MTKKAGRTLALVLIAWGGLGPPTASAQNRDRSELGASIDALQLSELDVADLGVGVHAVWRVAPTVALAGDLTWFPGHDDPALNRSADQGRLLALGGVRSIVPARRIEPFGTVEAGVLRFERRGSAVCIAIAIFPTPLECQLAAGYTAFAAKLGGGVNVGFGRSRRTRLEVTAGDLIVRYGRESFRPGGKVSQGFLSHNLLLTAGAAWRF